MESNNLEALLCSIQNIIEENNAKPKRLSCVCVRLGGFFQISIIWKTKAAKHHHLGYRASQCPMWNIDQAISPPCLPNVVGVVLDLTVQRVVQKEFKISMHRKK